MPGGIVHPTSQQILDFLCDQLPPQCEREVALHLEACSGCQSLLDETAPGSAQAHYDLVLDRVSARASEPVKDLGVREMAACVNAANNGRPH
jgi:hypothetical protein